MDPWSSQSFKGLWSVKNKINFGQVPGIIQVPVFVSSLRYGEKGGQTNDCRPKRTRVRRTQGKGRNYTEESYR